jgi:hypothetical protein
MWLGAVLASAQAPQPVDELRPADGPVRYTAAGELIKPGDFREWVFLASGLGMTYTPPAAAGGAPSRPPAFTNVYVNPASYREFMKTGRWKDQTVFILEVRESASEGSINLGGRYQTGVRVIEAEVKDSRLPGGWAFYNFGAAGDRAPALPKTAPCYACHSTKGAVEQTFVQFYPTLLDVARSKATLNPGHLTEP